MLVPNDKPVRTVLRWQVVATAVLALLTGLLGGIHGAFSALLGGAVSMIGGLASARTLANARTRTRSISSADALIGALKAEMVKIAVIALLLWLVFGLYEEVNAMGFIGTFAVTTVIFSLAIAVRDN